MDHLTERQIADFTARTLSPADLLAVDDHLQECAPCRRRLLDAGRLDAGLAAWQEAVGVAPARPPAAVPASLEPASARASRRWWLAAAAAALAAAFAAGGWWVWRGEEPPAARPAELAEVRLPAEVAGLPAAWRERVRAAAAAGRLDPPAHWSRLFVAGESIRRGTPAGAPGFDLLVPIGPIATAVRDGRPELRWAPLPGATDYEVAVYDGRYRKVAEGRVTELRWIPDPPLPRGGLYSWRVTAHRPATAGGPVTAPRPPAPEARFSVLAAGAAEAVARGERQAGSPLARAVLYADAGLADEAAGALAAWVRAEPGSLLARRLLASVNAWRPMPPPG